MLNEKIKVGITGSTGVLGTILTKKLKQKNYNVVIFQSDIRKISKVRNWIKNNNFDAIFHLASLVPVKLCNDDPLKACSINIGGTNNILNSIKSLDKKPWLFYASTSHVYKLKKTPLSETDNISPRTFYGYTKWMGEKLLENIYLSNNINFCIGRIFSFYSNAQSEEFLYSAIRKKIRENLNKKNIFIFNANNVLDIQRAENVVKIIIKLFEKKAGGTFNIGTGKGIEIKRFVKKVTKKKITILTNTKKKTIVVANIKKLNSLIL
ncbi:SDR family oxidoreductase [Candidatus Pelagibacter sp.]|jgi:nucleoside-diphosphate-sugar epimerase|nr:SDR family oxidoreductase [Candidatus Pelagibacter sp.]